MDGPSFNGFPAGKLRSTAIPDLFFTGLLPAIDSAAELRVTLHLFYLVSKATRPVKAISLGELQGDTGLLRGLRADGQELEGALQAAVSRGTVLHCRLRGQDGVLNWYFLNTESGRDAYERVFRGKLRLDGDPLPPERGDSQETPGIFTLYEQNIGLLQPLIVEELEEAQTLYPADWIEEAFKIAVDNNVRRWKYIRRILERWRDEGKGDERCERDHRADGSNYLNSKYADRIKH